MDHTSLNFQKASKKDLGVIRTLALEIWPETYKDILPPDQIRYMLDMMYSTAALEQQFSNGHEFILLYDEATPVGFASFSEVEPSVFKLHKIYVLPGRQGKGIGRLLVREVERLAGLAGAKALRLNVNRHNKAKTFYEKLDFLVKGSEDIDIGSGFFMNDYIMEKTIDTSRI